MAAKVTGIRDFPQPESQCQLRKFLGMVMFCHRFLPHCAQTLAPLHDLAHASNARNANLTWTDACISTFNTIKTMLADATLLVHPDPNAHTSVAADASSNALGAVLQHYQDGQWYPLTVSQRKLSSTEANYSTFGHELLAIYSTVTHFQYFLEGRHFTVFTDHAVIPVSVPVVFGLYPLRTR